MNKKPIKDGRAGVGMAFTCAWVGMLVVYVISNFDAVTNLAPNEFGDFLAGAFGPVALFWLVIGYFQQGEELQQNTEALRLQHEELMNSVAEQKHLVQEQRQQNDFMQAQLNQQIMAAQPYLEIVGYCRSRNSTSAEWETYIKNHGMHCSNLFLEGAGATEPWRIGEAGRFETGGSRNIYFQTKSAFETADCIVHYVDSLNIPRKIVYTLRQGQDAEGDAALTFTRQAENFST